MTELSKLEQEIWIELTNGHMRSYQCRAGGIEPGILGTEEAAKAIAELCRKKIELALDYNPALVVQELCGMKTYEEVKDQWIKDNL